MFSDEPGINNVSAVSVVVASAPLEAEYMTDTASVASVAVVSSEYITDTSSAASEVASEPSDIDQLLTTTASNEVISNSLPASKISSKLVNWGDFRKEKNYAKASLAKKQQLYQQFIDEVLPQNALLMMQDLETVQNEFRAIVPMPTAAVKIAEVKKISKESSNTKATPKGVLTWWEFQRRIVFETLTYQQQQNAYDYFVNTVVPHNAVLMGKNRQEAISAFQATVARP